MEKYPQYLGELEGRLCGTYLGPWSHIETAALHPRFWWKHSGPMKTMTMPREHYAPWSIGYVRYG